MTDTTLNPATPAAHAPFLSVLAGQIDSYRANIAYRDGEIRDWRHAIARSEQANRLDAQHIAVAEALMAFLVESGDLLALDGADAPTDYADWDMTVYGPDPEDRLSYEEWAAEGMALAVDPQDLADYGKDLDYDDEGMF